jgi:hypothetical protein
MTWIQINLGIVVGLHSIKGLQWVVIRPISIYMLHFFVLRLIMLVVRRPLPLRHHRHDRRHFAPISFPLHSFGMRRFHRLF